MKKLNRAAFSVIEIVILIVVLGILGTICWRFVSLSDKTQDVDLSNVKTLSKTPFSFTAAGDFGFTDDAKNVLSGIGKQKADFTLALGDLGYGGNGTEAKWCAFVTERVGADYPFELIAGNHDDGSSDGDIKEYRKCLPDRLKNIEGDYGLEYYFDHNNLARFIMISPDINNYGFAYTKGSPHYDWVAKTIADAKSKNISWIILGMHKNCFTIGTKSCEIGEDIINLAVKSGVDIVLQGHEHSYFRSKQLSISDKCPALRVDKDNAACVSASGDSFTKGKGTIIAIVGTGGQPLREFEQTDTDVSLFQTWNASNAKPTYGFSSFAVSEKTIESKFVRTSGQNYADTFTIAADN